MTNFATALNALNDLSQEMLAHEPSCLHDPRFTQDDHSAELVLRLAEICATCTLFDACETYAQLERPKAGVWAGRKYRSTNRKESQPMTRGNYARGRVGAESTGQEYPEPIPPGAAMKPANAETELEVPC